MKKIINAFVYALMFVAIQAMVAMVVHFVWQQIVGGTDITTAELVTTLVAFSVVVITVFLLAGWTQVSPRWLLTKQWSVLLWSVLAAVGLMVPVTFLQERMPELPNWIEDQQEMLMTNYWGYLAIGLLAPLAEEMVFRGAILRTLLGWNNTLNSPLSPYTAITVSAILFALIHMNPAQMPYAFLAGCLLGWMYWRTGSILPGIAFHWANNSMAYIVYSAYPDKDMKLIDLFKGYEQHVYMAVFFSLLICVPAIYQLYLRMRRAE